MLGPRQHEVLWEITRQLTKPEDVCYTYALAKHMGLSQPTVSYCLYKLAKLGVLKSKLVPTELKNQRIVYSYTNNGRKRAEVLLTWPILNYAPKE